MGTGAPETRYARSEDVHIAYQVFGDGPLDLVVVPGFFSHLELIWEHEPTARFYRRLGAFARTIMFDRRGSGLSDPVPDAPPLEVRMDDVRAVMDAAGSERAALVGMSEGAAMGILFAATHPERVSALVCLGALARSTEADDYPWGAPAEALVEANAELVAPFWGQGATIDVAAPSRADDPATREWYGRMERSSASPGMFVQLGRMFLEIDVREAARSVHVPTLLVHQEHDRLVHPGHARWLAENMPDARLAMVPGDDHSFFYGNTELVLGEIEEFLTGARPAPPVDRVLATMLFTDIVDSTATAARLGDREWRAVLERHEEGARAAVARFGGRTVKWTGDGLMATFDGPARAVRCAHELLAAAREEGVRLRAGVHTGEVEVMGDDIGGIGVHIAARVGARAQAEEVLCSRTVKDLVAGSGLLFEERGAHELKGVPDRWELFSASDPGL